MTDNEMVQYLRDCAEKEICDYEDCHNCPEVEHCLFEFVMPKIANRLEELIKHEEQYRRLKKEIDDGSMDHTCDYLEWYYEENEKLMEENKKLQIDLQKYKKGE